MFLCGSFFVHGAREFHVRGRVAHRGENSSNLQDDEIHALLAERLQAKLSRDFNTADGIQAELIENGVYVHDGFKQWRADGVPFGNRTDEQDWSWFLQKVDETQDRCQSAQEAERRGAQKGDRGEGTQAPGRRV